MATKRQVMCINKPGNRNNPYISIQNIGGIEDGVRWKTSENDAILNIRNGIYLYFVSRGRIEVKVIVAIRNGREYLKTEPDDGKENNLLELRECP